MGLKNNNSAKPVVIDVSGVWKKFRLAHEKTTSLKELFLRRRRTTYEEFWALKDVSFKVRKGETLGVIGENGSGKSTLLKLLTGILRPDKGEIRMSGRVSALLELGAGFHPELTGRENIYLNGSILGLSKKEIDERFDEIVSFAELEKFIDTPVKNYSSGMYVRLGFSIAVHAEPDVIIVDEILAVGDEMFQSKCYETFFDFKERGKTNFIVTHDLYAVQKFCDYCLWLDEGQIAAQGSPLTVIDAYLSGVHRKEQLIAKREASDEMEMVGKRWGEGGAKIVEVELLDCNGKAKKVFSTGEALQLRIKYRLDKHLDALDVGVSIFGSEGSYCYGTNTKADNVTVKPIGKTGVVTLKYGRLPLLDGRYFLDIGIFDVFSGRPYDYLSKVYSFKMRGGNRNLGEFGLFHLDHVWEVDTNNG